MVFKRRLPPPLPNSFPDERYQGFLGFKPPLREDFQYRCAYCQFHEWHRLFGGPRTFAVDHFRPRTLLTAEEQKSYGNLCYACGFCNTAKGHKWPTPGQRQAGLTILDPCEEDLVEEFTDYSPSDGSIRGRTRAA